MGSTDGTLQTITRMPEPESATSPNSKVPGSYCPSRMRKGAINQNQHGFNTNMKTTSNAAFAADASGDVRTLDPKPLTLNPERASAPGNCEKRRI